MKADNIQLKKMTLENLLFGPEKYAFEIPGYQRPYEWKQEQIETLLDGLTEAYKNKPEDVYLVGTLQFNSAEETTNAKTLEVVDGHQRITTFYLLLRCLGETPKIQYYNAINGESSIEVLLQKEQRYRQNYEYIEKYFAENRDSKISKTDFTRFLKANVLFVSIVLKKDANGSSISDALQIFDALNTTGLSLDFKDIFKIRFCDYLKGSVQNEEKSAVFPKINQAYNNVLHPLGDNPSAEIYCLSENDLLDTYRFFVISQTGKVPYASALSDSNNKFFEAYFGATHVPDFQALSVFCSIADCMMQTQQILFERDNKPVKSKTDAIRFCAREFTSESGYSKLKNLYYYLIFIQWKDGCRGKVDEAMVQNADEIMDAVWKFCSIYRLICAKVIHEVFNKVGEAIFQKDITSIRKNINRIFSENIQTNLQNGRRSYENFKQLLTETGDIRHCNKQHLFVKLSYIDDIDCLGEAKEAVTVYRIKKDLFYRDKWDLDIEHILSQALYPDNNSTPVQAIGNLMYLKNTTNRSLGDRTKRIIGEGKPPEESRRIDLEGKRTKYENDRKELICVDVFLKTYPQKDFLSARNKEKCAFLKDLYQNYPMLLKTEENSAP